MGNELEAGTPPSDSAAVFACALSLWEATKKQAMGERLNLSECYNGVDQLMREVMRIGNQFEGWACRHISFEALSDVWPYLLEDRFGDACLDVLLPSALTAFDETDCLRVALRLRFPVKVDNKLAVPIVVCAANPVVDSAFRGFRIQTVRSSLEDNDATPFTADDDPFDENFSRPYFGIYGVNHDGRLEHITDRPTYGEALSLVQSLAPAIELPAIPTTSGVVC